MQAPRAGAVRASCGRRQPSSPLRCRSHGLLSSAVLGMAVVAVAVLAVCGSARATAADNASSTPHLSSPSPAAAGPSTPIPSPSHGLARHLYTHRHLPRSAVRITPLAARSGRSMGRNNAADGISLQHSHHIAFAAYNYSLQLLLQPDARVRDSGIAIRVLTANATLQSHAIDHHNYLHGVAAGFPSSVATVYLRQDGNILARIMLPNETLFVEPAYPHYDAQDGTGRHRDMIVYSSHDIRPDSWQRGAGAKAGRGDHHQFCGSMHHDQFLQQQQQQQQEQQQQQRRQQPAADGESLSSPVNSVQFTLANRTTATSRHRLPTAQARPWVVPDAPLAARHRRATASAEFNTCLMTVVADYRFHLYHQLSVADTTAAMIQHVDVANTIYRRTVFGSQQGLGLGVRSVLILSSSASDPFYQQSNWEASTMLQVLSSQFDFSDSCLAHLFTRVDFPQGTVGLAWVGSPERNRAGGLCSNSRTSDLQSLNTGLSTNLNFGSNLPFATSALVLSHEVGHNWGSEHDAPDDPVCAPNDAMGGKYIMFALAVDGKQANNNAFSSCSRTSMNRVIEAKGSCFSKPAAGVCGNRLVEPGGSDGNVDTVDDNEECDAGGETACCTASCKLKPGKTCEPTNNACCNPGTCAGYERSDNVVCFQPFDFDTQCRDTGYCTMESGAPACESPLPAKLNGTVCGNGGRCQTPAAPSTQYENRCVDFCARFGAEACNCDGQSECRTCCRPLADVVCDDSNCNCPFRRFGSGNSSSCKLASEVLTFTNLQDESPQCYRDVADMPSTAFELDPQLDRTCTPTAGSPCQKILNRLAGQQCSLGACNLDGRCVAVDTGVARFWGGIGDLSIDTIAQWAKHNIVGAVMVVVLILWLPCGVCISRYDKRMRAKDPNYGILKGDADLRYRGHRHHGQRGSMRRSFQQHFTMRPMVAARRGSISSRNSMHGSSERVMEAGVAVREGRRQSRSASGRRWSLFGHHQHQSSPDAAGNPRRGSLRQARHAAKAAAKAEGRQARRARRHDQQLQTLADSTGPSGTPSKAAVAAALAVAQAAVPPEYQFGNGRRQPKEEVQAQDQAAQQQQQQPPRRGSRGLHLGQKRGGSDRVTSRSQTPDDAPREHRRHSLFRGRPRSAEGLLYDGSSDPRN